MEQMDSIRGELQTLIALEQQQVETLGAIHSRGAFNPTPMQVGGFGYGQSHYMPGMGAFQRIPALGNYMNQVQGALNYAQNSIPFMPTISTMADKMRNAMMSENLDSMGFFSANQSKMSNEAREMMGANMGAKFSAGALGAASMFSGTAGSFLGQALGKAAFGGGLTGAAGGLLFGAAGGAVIGGTVDIMNDQVKQNFAYDRYLLQNSNKFIDVFESNNDRNVGGFSRKERWNMSNWLRHFNTENYMTDDDTMTLLKNFTEGDLLREVSNVDNFKEKMSQLTDSVKSMALSLNETYENVAQMMADLKRKGIDQRDYKNIAATSKVIGGLTGQDATEVMENTTDLTYSIAQRYGNGLLDPDKVLRSVQGTMAYIGNMYENGDDATRSLITNMGGQEAAAGFVSNTAYSWLAENNTQFSQYSGAFVTWDPSKNNGRGGFVFDESKYKEFKDGNYSLSQLAQEAANNLESIRNQYGIDSTATWTRQQGTVMQEAFGGAVDQAGYMLEIINAARKTVGQPNASIEDILQYFGYEGAEANLMGSYLNMLLADGGKLESQISAAGVAQAMVSDYQAHHPGAWYSVKNEWGEFKDALGDVGDAVATPWRVAGRAFSDWWMGRPVEDMQQLWAGTDWTENPFDDFTKSMANYQEALRTMGASESQIAAANPLMFGLDINKFDSRNVYEDGALKDALGKLTKNIESLSGTIQEASKKGGISENVAAAVVGALSDAGALDKAGGAETVIGELSSQIQAGATDEAALRNILSQYGISEVDQTNVITQFGVGQSSVEGMKEDDPFAWANETFGLNSNFATDAANIFGRDNNGYTMGSGAGSALVLNEMLGLGYTSKTTRDSLGLGNKAWGGAGIGAAIGLIGGLIAAPFTGGLSVLGTAAGIGLAGGATLGAISGATWEGLDGISALDKAGFDKVNQIKMGSDIYGELREAKRLYEDKDAWKKLSVTDRYNYKTLLTEGAQYYKDIGKEDSELYRSIYGDLDESAYSFNQNSITMDEDIYITDEEKAAYRKALSSRQELVSEHGTKMGFISGENQGTVLNALQSGKYGNAEALNVFGGENKSMGETKKYLQGEIDRLAEELSPVSDKMDIAKGDLADALRASGGEDLWKEIEAGNITSMIDATEYAKENGISENVVSSNAAVFSRYFTAKDEYDKISGGISAATGALTEFTKSEASIEAYRTGFTALARVLGMDPDKTVAMDKIYNDMSKAQSDVANTRDNFSAYMFGGHINETIDYSNKSQIASDLALKLYAHGEMSQTQANELAKSFVDSSVGKRIDQNLAGSFINQVAGSVAFGSEESKLKSAMDKNTEAIEANTRALLDPKAEKERLKENNSGTTENAFDLQWGDAWNNTNGTANSSSGNTQMITFK